LFRDFRVRHDARLAVNRPPVKLLFTPHRRVRRREFHRTTPFTLPRRFIREKSQGFHPSKLAQDGFQLRVCGPPRQRSHVHRRRSPVAGVLTRRRRRRRRCRARWSRSDVHRRSRHRSRRRRRDGFRRGNVVVCARNRQSLVPTDSHSIHSRSFGRSFAFRHTHRHHRKGALLRPRLRPPAAWFRPRVRARRVGNWSVWSILRSSSEEEGIEIYRGRFCSRKRGTRAENARNSSRAGTGDEWH